MATVTLVAALLVAQTTLTFTPPTLHVDGTPISDGYRRWELAYSTQSKTWQAHGLAMMASPDTFTTRWPATTSEADRRIVMYGYGRPGVPVVQVAPLVNSLDWPFSWWVRYFTDVPGGWSNPVTRASN